MSRVELRLYVPEDLEDVVAVFRSNIPNYFVPGEEPGLRQFLNSGAENYYVLEIDSKVVGSGGVALNEDGTVSLCWGMIRADHLGTGLGKSLTEFRIRKAREAFGSLPLVISSSQHTEGFTENSASRPPSIRPTGLGPGWISVRCGWTSRNKLGSTRQCKDGNS